MLHVITSANRHLYADFIEQQHQIRYDIYVKGRGWRALDRPDKREVDQFDTEHAVYLLASEEGRVIGGSRLVPTTHPHLMSEVFPELASVKGLQQAPDIFEWTRFFVVANKRETHRSCDVSGEIAVGVYEFCLSEGIRRMTVVFETYWLTRFLEYGWNIEPLGLPQLIDGNWTIGVAIEVTPDGLASVRETRGIHTSVLERRGPQISVVPPEVPRPLEATNDGQETASGAK